MKWKIQTEQKTFAALVDNVLAIVDETKMVIDADGLHISAVDPAHVCMLLLDVPKSAFKTWQFDGEEVEIGLMLNKISTYLKIYGKDEILTIAVDDNLSTLEIDGEHINHKTPLLDVDGMTDAKKPQLSLEDSFKIKARYLHTAIKGGKIIGEHLNVLINKYGVQFTSEEDEDVINVKIREENLEEMDHKSGKKQIGLYALDYISALGSMVGADTVLDISIKSDYPMIVKFPIAESGTVEFLCAPRIEGTDGE